MIIEPQSVSLASIDWFRAAASPQLPALPFSFRQILSLDDATTGFESSNWVDIKTEALGDLTSYLYRNHNTLYSPHWNDAVLHARGLVQESARNSIVGGLQRAGLPIAWLDGVVFDCSLALVETAYRKRVKKAPVFFANLLLTYESGRLPCGWSSELSDWQSGKLLVF